MGNRRHVALGWVTTLVLATACGSTTHSRCPAIPNDIYQPAALSTIPDPLSALNEDQIHLGVDGAAVVRRSDENTSQTGEGFDQTDWMGSANALVCFTPGWFTAYLGGSGAMSTLAETADRTQLTGMAGVGLRMVTENGETHWRGMAIRVDGAVGEVVSAKGDETESDPFLTLRPLDAMRFGRDEHLQVIAEIRYELMGCYGPFLHLTGGGRWDMPDDDVIFTVPFSLNIGAHRELGGDPIIVFGGLDLDIVEPMDVPEFLPRLRFGVETLNLTGETGIRLGFTIEIVVGQVDGAYGGLTATFPLSKGIRP
jgi:hypothetical protein